jgi:hypothetical protein
MKGLEDSFNKKGAGTEGDPIVTKFVDPAIDAIKKRRKELSEWWNKPSPTPKPE